MGIIKDWWNEQKIQRLIKELKGYRLECEPSYNRDYFWFTYTEQGKNGLLFESYKQDYNRVIKNMGILINQIKEEMERLKSRFRRIRYGGGTRPPSEAGESPAGLDTVRSTVREWGIERIISNFTDDAFDRFRNSSGIVDAEAAAMSLEDIFASVVWETTGGES